jgi:hypothetical protein
MRYVKLDATIAHRVAFYLVTPTLLLYITPRRPQLDKTMSASNQQFEAALSS